MTVILIILIWITIFSYVLSVTLKPHVKESICWILNYIGLLFIGAIMFYSLIWWGSSAPQCSEERNRQNLLYYSEHLDDLDQEQKARKIIQIMEHNEMIRWARENNHGFFSDYVYNDLAGYEEIIIPEGTNDR